MNATEMIATIGKQGEWSLPHSPIRIGVVVLDVRKAYNRVDYLVRPVSGNGTVWVNSENVTLEGKE